MPSLSLYKKMYSPQTNGQAHKNQSDEIIDITWWNDINSRVAYLYDCYHDDEPMTLRNTHPTKSKIKVPIDIKFLQNSQQTYDKDVVTFHIQFRPGQKCNVPYYKEVFDDRYDAIFPIGLYIDIEDESGQYNRWLIVDKANFYGTQFPTFEILPCDTIVRYIFDGIKYKIPGVLRSQNSYNSGIWTDHLATGVEDQQKFAIPLNRETESIYYQQRFIIDGRVQTEPRTWRITKINRVSPNGIVRATLAQTVFNQHTDYCEVVTSDGITEYKPVTEIDITDNVIAWWPDYNATNVEPIENDTSTVVSKIRSSISYSGIKPEIKSNGGFKKFSVNFFDENNEEISYQFGTWSYSIDGSDASSLLDIKTYPSSSDLDQNQIKIKFIGGDKYIGSVLRILFRSSNTESYLDVNISSL